MDLNGNKVRRVRVAIKTSVRHQLYLKHKGQCAHVDEWGHQCNERRHLEIHHLKPVASGGCNELWNLTIYCSGHHKSHHLLNDQLDRNFPRMEHP